MAWKSTHANRGTVLEHYVEQANATYRQRNRAAIHKNPPHIKITKIDKRGQLTGFIEAKGYVDYDGISEGRYIAFDAKETNNKTSFALSNIEPHQYEHLKDAHDQRGTSFILLHFAAHNEVYILTFKELQHWWENAKMGQRKSIPYTWVKENCRLCSAGNGIALNYLDAI